MCPADLHVVGMGDAQCRRKVESLLTHRSSTVAEPPNGLLFLGFAGAIDPGLETGDLVLSERYHRAKPAESLPTSPFEKEVLGGFLSQAPPQVPRHEGGDYLTPDPVMWRRSLEAASGAGLPLTQVDSLTVDGLATTSAAKAALGRRYPVGIVNMEDYWVAAVARDAGVPFLSTRVVLDPASQGLPGYLPGLARSRPKAVFTAAAMPWRIPTLLGLGRQMRLAQQVLARFALSYIVGPWDGDLAMAGPAPANTAR
jgi:nucleoside phosphorylase